MPLHGQRYPRETPSAEERETTALVHFGKMRGRGGGFPAKKKVHHGIPGKGLP
jgi:hypothetical protein